MDNNFQISFGTSSEEFEKLDASKRVTNENVQVSFRDSDDEWENTSAVRKMMREWKNIIDGRPSEPNCETEEDISLDDIVANNIDPIPMTDSDGNDMLVYSTGFKSNGKIDICIKNLTLGKEYRMENCSLSDISITEEQDSPN